MPIYVYECSDCHNKVEVIKNVSKLDDSVFCECGASMHRIPSFMGSVRTGNSPTRVRDNVYEGWNPGLNCYVKSKAHYNQILKEKGVECMGNEKLAPTPVKKKEHKYFDDKTIEKIVKEDGVSLSDVEVKELKSL